MNNDSIPGWKRLLELCLQQKNHADLNQLFNLLLTIEEKETLASRCLIIDALLEKKLPQREISEKYNVSIAQITRGSNALKIVDADFKKSIEKKNDKS